MHLAVRRVFRDVSLGSGAENMPTSLRCGERALEEIMVKLTPRLLKVLLDQDGLRAEGTFEELRDRRLGFDVMKVDTGLDVPVYDNDFRREGVPVTTSELLMQYSHEEFVLTRPGERAPAGPADNTQALGPMETGGN